MRFRPGRSRCGEEGGSALIIALLVSTALSVVVASILTFTDVGLKAKKSFEGRDKVAYAADGAVETAINRFRLGNSCDDYSAPTLNGQNVVVRCKDLGSSGGGIANKPPAALLSVGNIVGEDGIASNNAAQRVRGNVFSQSTVNVGGGGSMVVEGGVSAAGACSGAIQATTQQCGLGADVDPHGRDPDFLKATNTIPRRQTVPACGAGTPSWLVTLEPGYYDDAAALNLLTASAACPNSVIWMRPGTYYFDFSFHTGAEGTWTIDEPTVNVVGGTETPAWNPAGATKQSPFPVPGACIGPGEQPSANGVQVIVGGTSHLDILRGTVELCAQPSSTDQEIALYGLAPDRLHHVLAPTAVSSSDGFSTATVGNALTIGENPPNPANALTADATLNEDGPQASITLGGYRPSVVAGSMIDSAVLRVAHHENANVDVSVTVGGCTGPTKLTLGTSPTATEERFDLSSCGVTAADDFPGLTVTYTADLASGSTATEHLDGVWVEVAYRPPATRKPTAGASVAGFTAFTNVANAFDIGEQPVARSADAAVTDGNPAAIVLSGLADPPIPPGSVIDSAVLRVAHHDPGNVATVSVTPSSAGCSAQNLPVRASAITIDSVDLKATCSGFDASKLAALTVRYDVGLTGGGAPTTVHLDGIRLDIVYRPHRQATTATIVSGFPAQADADKAKVIDGDAGDALLDSTGGPTSASLTLSTGFETPTVPPGTTLDSALLRIVHREGGDINAVSITPSFASSTNTCTAAQPLPVRRTALTPDTFDLKACGLTEADLAGLAVTFAADLAPAGAPSTESLDGIELEVAWKQAATHKPTLAAPTDFANPNNALEIGESPAPLTADATLTAADSTASITLSGYGQPALPEGSFIESATLRVAHHDDTGVVPTVTVPIGGAPCTNMALTPRTAGIGEDAINLKTACGFDDAADLFDTVTYDAALGTAADPSTDRLDGIWVDIVFRPPTFEALAGCVATGPYPTAGCALVRTAGASPTTTRFLVDGTVYAPSAAVDLTMSQLSSQVVTRGVVARTVHLDLAPATSPAFQRPTIGAPNPELVSFTAYPNPVHLPAIAASAGGNFVNPDDGKLADGTTTDATLAATEVKTIDLSDFGSLPSGALDSLVLRVAHADDFTGPELPAVEVSVVSDSTPVCVLPALPLHPGALTTASTDRIDLKALCTFADGADLKGFKVTYKVALPAGASSGADRLDGVSLEVLSNPVLRAQVAFDHGNATVEGWSVLR